MRLHPLGLLVDKSDTHGATLALVVPVMQTESAEIFGLTVKLIAIETVAQITVSQN